MRRKFRLERVGTAFVLKKIYQKKEENLIEQSFIHN